MNDEKNILSALKGRSGRIILFLGIAGILLIYLSSMIPKEKKQTPSPKTDTTAAYCAELETKVASLVKSITGSKKVSVAVTLDSGKQFVYADEGRHSQSDSGDDSEQSYIIVRSSNGDEGGLLVTEYLPIVRGVAIVCGNLSATQREDIKSAVCAALDISERKIYVTQYAQ